MAHLPSHGRVTCDRCFSPCKPIEFDKTRRTEKVWRITANPLAWGSNDPEVVILGFSKGSTQAGALASTPHDEIAYKGARKNVGKILRHVGLLPGVDDDDLRQTVSRLIAQPSGRLHFGSLIRCTVEQNIGGAWKGSGGGMLDKFTETDFGKEVTLNCITRFLGTLPLRTKLIVMFGMGAKLNYVHASFELFKVARGGNWKMFNEVAYTDGIITVVHVEHFASLGGLIPKWLGQRDHIRGHYGRLAAEAVEHSLKVL